MHLSIVIPHYNRVECIKNLAEFISIQLIPKEFIFEIIVVDDGSNKKNLTTLTCFIGNHSFIKLLKQENAGPAEARLNGINAAVGNYIMLLDSDDIFDISNIAVVLLNEKLSVYDYICLKSSRTTVLLYGRIFELTEPIVEPIYPNKMTVFMFCSGILKSNNFNSSSIVYRSKFLREKYIISKITWGEDIPFLANVMQHGKGAATEILSFIMTGRQDSRGASYNLKNIINLVKEIDNVVNDNIFTIINRVLLLFVLSRYFFSMVFKYVKSRIQF